ncbi:ecotropic viral integration site 5 ortholog isoform X2 [Xiphias gladius]|uniref:ecotropic viral integration site 5 ortholog isoform X2 n=1 Tax=Xiphias gladius TaxID=8245 RepID=UPI001A99551F|nr:ecotropic viral integration site 5 ortholog isoform X2 [Xiphias gladius]XP_039976105.1 ecotropic viral integration site 5 ortholog isoform X2 [Xiphias gladius]XP_039976106.1 ecotropic viral integration site 5 ortholog isoform X2 [Xiphias gladius]
MLHERSVGPPPELVRQRETKWINIIFQWDRMLLKKTSKVKVQCQKGIPASLRAKCWPLLCAATDRMKQSENLYESLDSQPALQSWVDVIERDLDRQFPFHEMFLSKDGHGQRGLFRVLKAYTQYQPEEGYCQAQGPVAAVLLMNMPAEEAFWCLVQISEQYLPGYYSPLLEGVLFDAGMLTWVLKRTCPAAHKHLQHHGVEPLMFATDWLMCLFTRHLPFNTLLRVWDLFFCYGVRVLLQVAVVLVRRVLGRAEQRKHCQGQMETLERLRAVREQVQEEDDPFIAEVCSVPLSARDLEKQTEKELEKWRKDRPSSTFDPRGRCQGYRMAWTRARQNEEEQDRKEREKGNLSVPLFRSASTLSLSPSLLNRRLRKGGKVNTGEWEGGSKVVRHLSMGAREDWRSWNEFNFKKVQGVQEEEDVEEHKKQSQSKITGQTEEKELLEEPKKMDKVQNKPTEQAEETVMAKEQVEQVETRITEKEESQPKETENDKKLSEQTEEKNVETEPNQGPVKDQTIEIILQPTENTCHHEQGEDLESYSQSRVLEEKNHKDRDQEMEVRDTKEETEKQMSESEHSAAVEENLSEIQKDPDADTYLKEEQMIQADIKPKERTEINNEQQMQVDTVTEVSETRTETSPGSETDSNFEAATSTDPGLRIETETQGEVFTETEESSQDDAFGVKYHSTESLAEIGIKEESNTQTVTETEEKVRENATTQDDLETEIVKIDSEQYIDSKIETKTEAETLILSSPRCIKQEEDADVEADTEAETEIPVADNRVNESSEEFSHCSEKQYDAVASEPAQEKEEIILTVRSEAEVDDDQTQAEETPTETQTNVETTDSVAPPEEGKTSKQAEAVNLTTEPDGKTSSVEMSTSEEPAPEEPRSQATIGPLEEEESRVNVPENTVGEDNVFISTPNVTDNPHTDSNPQVQNKDDSPAGLNNSGLTQASGQRGDLCVRKPCSSRGSRLQRRLSEDLFTAPQKTSQSQSIPNHPEVKHTQSQSNPGAVNPSQTPPDVTQSSEVTSSMSAEVTERTAAEQGPAAPPKRFGLFRRLRGEQPKKTKGKGAQKMQVPKILIQDFSDGTETGKLVEEEGEEKLSSRERRRRRRERERREKEEDRLRKKKEKEMEKERERESRKPKTRGKSFQVQKERGSNDPSQSAKTGPQTLRYFASYAESYF